MCKEYCSDPGNSRNLRPSRPLSAPLGPSRPLSASPDLIAGSLSGLGSECSVKTTAEVASGANEPRTIQKIGEIRRNNR